MDGINSAHSDEPAIFRSSDDRWERHRHFCASEWKFGLTVDEGGYNLVTERRKDGSVQNFHWSTLYWSNLARMHTVTIESLKI